MSGARSDPVVPSVAWVRADMQGDRTCCSCSSGLNHARILRTRALTIKQSKL